LLYGELDTTRTAILVLISRLRHALEPDLDKQTPSRFVQFVDGRYRFNAALPFQLDTHEFEYRCRLGADASLPIETRRDHWRQALALYQGPYLAELTAEGAWLAIERERFHRLAQDAHTAIVRSYLDAGDDAGALEAAEANLAFDSCCELAHQVKMTCLARMGQRESAMRHYAIMKQVFERELGGPPSGTSQALYQSIARGQDALLPEALR
jgi:two-component SAPR family response regulator